MKPPKHSVDAESHSGLLIDLASELEDEQPFAAAVGLLRDVSHQDDLDALVIDLVNHAL